MTQEARNGRRAMAAMFAVNGFIIGAWAPQIPLLLPRHDITKTTLGLLILVLGIGAVGAMLFAGRLIARFGSRSVVRVFAVLAAPVLPAIVLSPNLGLLAAAMLAFGAVVGTMDVAMNANAVEVEHRLGRAIMSSSHGFWSLGGFAGAILGSQVVARFGADRQAIGVAIIALVVVLVAMRWLISEPVLPVQRNAQGQRAPLLPRDGALWVLGLMALFSMVPEGAVLDWAAIYLGKELGSDVTTSGYAFGFFAGAMAIMRFLGDRMRNRFGAVRTLQVSGFVAAIGMMGGALAPSDWAAIIGFSVAGLGVANMVPILFSAAGNHPGLGPGAGIAAVTMFGYSGILVVPSSIGFIADHIGFRWTYGALAFLLLVVALLAGRTAAADRRVPAAQAA